MIQNVLSTWIWAITYSGTPFMWTVTIQGLGGNSVTAEASLSKVVLGSASGAKHAKATVWTVTFMSGSSVNWGIDGPPIRFLSNVNYMSFALEVAGVGTYAWMTGKLYIH